MDAKNVPQMPRVTKESKNKIRIEMEDRTPFWTRMRMKIFSTYFLQNVIWYLFRLLLMIGVCFVILYPFISKIAGSFMSISDFRNATVRLIPQDFTLRTYSALFFERDYPGAFFNTLTLSLVCALIQTFVACLIGYGLTKFKFKGNKFVFMLVILTMIVPHQTLRLSLAMKFNYFDLGGVSAWGIPGLLGIFGIDANLSNTYWPMIILSATGLAFKNGLYIFMMRNFFTGVPDELEESAYVDGSGTMNTFFKIIIPLSIPMMITIFLFAFAWQWTDNFYVETFMAQRDFTLMPDLIKEIPESLKTTEAGYQTFQTAIRNTAGLMIIAPLLVLYLFCQRYLIQGIERSGIVG